MKKPKPRRKSALNDHHPHQGIGLLPSNNDFACLQKIYEVLPVFLDGCRKEDGLAAAVESLHEQKEGMLLVVRHYNADKADDDRFTFPQMKGEVRRLKKKMEDVHEKMSGLPKQVRSALNAEMRKVLKLNRDQLDHIQVVNEYFETLRAACDEILDADGSKRPRTCVVNACRRLWDMWETACGRRFIRTWTSASGRPKAAEEQFDNADAGFVHAVLTAIDPEIRLSQVRDGLKQVAKARGRSKSLEKEMRF
ncbi:hypothetical protein [Aureimonas psammosilenae]|uniref:hypothetical protein n=1 Tax=Aureimonas psammosilenae TaxID=2495496 RepID=UPI001260680D|nr:hypothetical protein [Aureimonas psammosilenae]